jgi:hypothetical protein
MNGRAIPMPFGLSLSKPSIERSEMASLRSAEPFDRLRANGDENS